MFPLIASHAASLRVQSPVFLRFMDPSLIHPDFFARLRAGTVRAPAGFSYGFAAPLFREDAYAELVASFPDVSAFILKDRESGGGRKRFYVGPRYASAEHHGCICRLRRIPDIWRAAFDEFSSVSCMESLRAATGIRLNSLANFGFTYGNEGCVQEPHIDGAVRSDDLTPIKATIACLIYCNARSGNIGGTEIYLPDRTTRIFSVPDMRNAFLFFEQHPDAWHGFPPLPAGHDRRLVSLAYSHESPPLRLTRSFLHRLLCPANIASHIPIRRHSR